MNRRRAALIGIVVVLVLGGAAVTYAVTRSSQEDIYLESANSTGPNPFTTTAVTPTSTTAVGVTTTALYGGSGSQQHCDPEALIAFLTTHADKAAAWIEALNSDPTLRWGEGGTKTKLTLADIPVYIRGDLTATSLKFDTRVTNNGFKNGHPTPRQSILQAGTAVLVDRYGTPRVRCACGNPLLPPHKVRDPHYKGECWPGCHDRPPCTGPNCTEGTTTTEPATTTTASVTTTTCVQTAGAAGCGPPVVSTTTTRRPTVTTVTTTPVTRTTLPVTTTVTTRPATTTSSTSPNNPGGPN
jgi:hypothetical protein